jgi:hypothetical protein
VRQRIEAAGIQLVSQRQFRSGRVGYFFGPVISGLPLTIYDARDDLEARGLA